MLDDDTAQTEKKQRRSPDDVRAHSLHPSPSNIDKPTRNRPHCRVLLLDGQYHTFPVDKKAKAFVAINELFHHLDLKDLLGKEFFSIYYNDTSRDTSAAEFFSILLSRFKGNFPMLQVVQHGIYILGYSFMLQSSDCWLTRSQPTSMYSKYAGI